MSRNTIELVAKFRDDASVGLRRLATEANRTMQIQSRAASSSGRQQQLMHAAAARLGIRTEREIRREIQRTQAAYNAMAKSGRASHNELARAAQQTRNRIRELNAEMNSGSRFNRMIQGGKSLARGATSVAPVSWPAVMCWPSRSTGQWTMTRSCVTRPIPCMQARLWQKNVPAWRKLIKR